MSMRAFSSETAEGKRPVANSSAASFCTISGLKSIFFFSCLNLHDYAHASRVGRFVASSLMLSGAAHTSAVRHFYRALPSARASLPKLLGRNLDDQFLNRVAGLRGGDNAVGPLLAFSRSARFVNKVNRALF